MLENLTASEHVELYLKSTGQDVEYLFCLAYLTYYGVSNVTKIQASVKEYEQTEEPPRFVRWFLTRKLS